MYKVKVENIKQLELVLTSKKVSDVILARDSFAEKDIHRHIDEIKKAKKRAWILMERISRYEEDMNKTLAINTYSKRDKSDEKVDLRLSTDKIYEIKNLDGIIIQNLDSYAYMLRKINKAANENLLVELNYTMNCYNFETKKLYMDLYNEKRKNSKDVPLLFTAPVELNIYELSDVGYDTIILYSYIDTMVSANCLRKNLALTGKNIDKKLKNDLCKNRFRFDDVEDYTSYIIDRKGKKLYYKTYCKYCYNKIFNTEPLYLLDKVDEIESVHHKPKYRIDFSFENEKEVIDILQGNHKDSFTRGHIKNTIK